MEKEDKKDPLKIDPLKALADFSKPFPTYSGDLIMPIEAIAPGMEIAKSFVGVIKVFAYWIARGVMTPCEIILRYHFGERYFNIFSIGALAIFFSWAYYGRGANRWVILSLCAVTVAGFAINQLRCFKRNRRGEYWHSYSEGESRIRVGWIDAYLAKNHFTIDASKIVIEPVMLMAAGWAIGQSLTYIKYHGLSDPRAALGGYLFLAGAIMLIYQFYLWLYRREKRLDEKDQKIEADAKLVASEPVAAPTIKTHLGLAYIPPLRPSGWSKEPPSASELKLAQLITHFENKTGPDIPTIQNHLEQLSRNNSGSWISVAARLSLLKTLDAPEARERRIDLLAQLVDDPLVFKLKEIGNPSIKHYFGDNAEAIASSPRDFVLWLLCLEYINVGDKIKADGVAQRMSASAWQEAAKVAVKQLRSSAVAAPSEPPGSAPSSQAPLAPLPPEPVATVPRPPEPPRADPSGPTQAGEESPTHAPEPTEAMPKTAASGPILAAMVVTEPADTSPPEANTPPAAPASIAPEPLPEEQEAFVAPVITPPEETPAAKKSKAKAPKKRARRSVEEPTPSTGEPSVAEASSDAAPVIESAAVEASEPSVTLTQTADPIPIPPEEQQQGTYHGIEPAPQAPAVPLASHAELYAFLARFEAIEPIAAEIEKHKAAHAADERVPGLPDLFRSIRSLYNILKPMAALPAPTISRAELEETSHALEDLRQACETIRGAQVAFAKEAALQQQIDALHAQVIAKHEDLKRGIAGLVHIPEPERARMLKQFEEHAPKDLFPKPSEG